MSTAPPLVPLHLGPLHPHEQLLTLVLAFGPFVLLAVVIAVRRRQDAALDAEGEPGGEQRGGTDAPGASPPPG